MDTKDWCSTAAPATPTEDTSLPSFRSCGCQPSPLHAAANMSSTVQRIAAGGSATAPWHLQCRCIFSTVSQGPSLCYHLADLLFVPVLRGRCCATQHRELSSSSLITKLQADHPATYVWRALSNSALLQGTVCTTAVSAIQLSWHQTFCQQATQRPGLLRRQPHSNGMQR
jgi:hypothetical protein